MFNNAKPVLTPVRISLDGPRAARLQRASAYLGKRPHELFRAAIALYLGEIVPQCVSEHCRCLRDRAD